MMLPASLPPSPAWLALGHGTAAAVARSSRPSSAHSRRLGAFGLVAFVGDVVLHRVVDATPWLAPRPWLVEAGVLVLAGAYQSTPLKRRVLVACRRSGRTRLDRGPQRIRVARTGLRHGLDCLGSSWALMLLMFAEGFANLWWMAALTAIMTYEATGRRGARLATWAGFALVFLGVAALSPSAPTGFAA